MKTLVTLISVAVVGLVGCASEPPLHSPAPWYGDDGDPSANAFADRVEKELNAREAEQAKDVRIVWSETRRLFGEDALPERITFLRQPWGRHAEWTVGNERVVWASRGYVYHFRVASE